MKALTILAVLLWFIGCATQETPPTHHDPVVEKWIGKQKKELVQSLGQPTRETKLSSGESTLVWEKANGCYLAFNLGKTEAIESGTNRCSEH